METLKKKKKEAMPYPQKVKNQNAIHGGNHRENRDHKFIISYSKEEKNPKSKKKKKTYM